ncbi:MAG: hypothetical protein LBU13_07960 [Synergistaceae bacterium]|jgi:hypothetical protein|nr:hypothetical protein [Synergistaceae bacterium]
MPKRRGFSLIIVLLILLVGLGMTGVMLQIVSVSSGAGRTASAANKKYNLLVSGVENARSKLIERLDSDDPIPGRRTAGMITSADMLLVMPEERRTLSRKELDFYGIAKGTGDLTVKIYDMQYAQADISPSMEPAEIKQLPPAVRLIGIGDASGGGPTGDDDLTLGSGGIAVNAGAYLIRALLEINGVQEGAIDLAIIESGKSSY